MKRTKIKILLISIAVVASAAYLSFSFSMEHKWGVKIEGIRLSVGGFMIDFRYKILDAKKALPLLDPKIKPYLVNEATGVKLTVPAPPKIGALRQTSKNGPPKEGRSYFMIFSNTNQYVKAGDKVAVVVGDFKADNILVQ